MKLEQFKKCWQDEFELAKAALSESSVPEYVPEYLSVMRTYLDRVQKLADVYNLENWGRKE